MNPPLISIVMPCYQCEKWVGRMVTSVQAQTVVNWELIAVDDGSRDGTLSVLQALAEDEPRMRVLHQENGGVCAARNRALCEARGQWITFVDADDALPPRALETLLSLADEETDAVCGACEIIRDGTRAPLTCAHGDRTALMESLVRGDSALNNMCGKLHRASVIREHGILLTPGVAIGEDVLFNLEVLSVSRAWRVTDENVYDYYVQADSAMERARRDVYARSLPMLHGIDAFIEKNGLQTALFRAHIDAYLRTLRADRGRLLAAFAMCGAPARAITKGVDAASLPLKQRAYHMALRLLPVLSYFIP